MKELILMGSGLVLIGVLTIIVGTVLGSDNYTFFWKQ